MPSRPSNLTLLIAAIALLGAAHALARLFGGFALAYFAMMLASVQFNKAWHGISPQPA